MRKPPLEICTLEEIIDEDHAIISQTHGNELYVNIMSFVDKDQLTPKKTVLVHNKNKCIVGILDENTDPLLSAMKIEVPPKETYSDIGGL